MAFTEGVFVAELADVLARFGALRCAPTVVSDETGLTLTVTVSTTGQADARLALSTLDLFIELQHVQDVAQLRLLSERYGIEPGLLERFVRKET